MSSSSYDRKLLHEQARALRDVAGQSKDRARDQLQALLEEGKSMGLSESQQKGYLKHCVGTAKGEKVGLGMSAEEIASITPRQRDFLQKYKTQAKRQIISERAEMLAQNAEASSKGAGKPDGPIEKFRQRIMNAIRGKGFNDDETLQEAQRDREARTSQEVANEVRTSQDQEVAVPKASTPKDSAAVEKAFKREKSKHLTTAEEKQTSVRARERGDSVITSKSTVREQVTVRNAKISSDSRLASAPAYPLGDETISPFASSPLADSRLTDSGLGDSPLADPPQASSPIADSPLGEDSGFGPAVGSSAVSSSLAMAASGEGRTFDDASREGMDDDFDYSQFSAANRGVETTGAPMV